MPRSLIVSALVGAVALSGCSKDDKKAVQDIVDPVIQTTEFVCDVRQAMKPPELALGDVLEAVDKGCAWLKAFNGSGILPSAPAADTREFCAVLKDTSAGKTEGYWRLCNPLVNRFRGATTVYEEAAARLFPGYEAFAPLIAFNTANTDSLVCGEEAVTGISMCDRELYLRPHQLLTYESPETATAYAACHEVGHAIQWQVEGVGPFGLLSDYAENQAFRETQGDCICGGLDAEAGATASEISDFVETMTSIGDLVTHGSAEQRVAEYLFGIEEGAAACLVKQPSPTQT